MTLGPEAPFIAKLLVKLLAQIKGSDIRKTTIRQTLQRDVSRLKSDINLLLSDAYRKIKNKYPKGFLVIFDNLDRVPPGVGDHLFFDYAAQLQELNCTLIFTVPISVLCSPKNLSNTFGNPHIVQWSIFTTCSGTAATWMPNLDLEAQQFLSLNQHVFAELLTFVDFADEFTLGFVEINFPPDTDVLIQALKTHINCQDIQFEVLDFAHQPNLRFLRDEIVKQLPTIQPVSDQKLVLIIRGLAQVIGVSGDYPPVLQDLNFVRDAYKTSVPHPLLFVLPDYAITRLAKFSPDFWAWKSGVFLFRTPETTRNQVRAQTIDSPDPISSYGPPEKQECIDLLERLLMEYRPSRQPITPENLGTCATILHQLGGAYLSRHNPAKAKEYLEEALACAQQRQDVSLQTEIYNDLGRAHQQQQQQAAMTAHETSLKLSQQLGDRRGEATALFYLGTVSLRLRNFQQARSLYQQCLEIYKELGDRYAQAITYHQLGIVAEDLREFEEARRHYQQALEIKIEFGDRYAQASTYYCLGTLAEEQGDYKTARANLQQALERYVEFKDTYWAENVQEVLECIAQKSNDS